MKIWWWTLEKSAYNLHIFFLSSLIERDSKIQILWPHIWSHFVQKLKFWFHSWDENIFPAKNWAWILCSKESFEIFSKLFELFNLKNVKKNSRTRKKFLSKFYYLANRSSVKNSRRQPVTEKLFLKFRHLNMSVILLAWTFLNSVTRIQIRNYKQMKIMHEISKFDVFYLFRRNFNPRQETFMITPWPLITRNASFWRNHF